MRDYVFCTRCGERLSDRAVDGRVRPYCRACGNVEYLNPSPAVAAVLLQSGRVLLVKRGVEPGLGLWALPSGFMETDESPEQALVREVLEETSIHCKPGVLLGVTNHHDPHFGQVLVLAYTAHYSAGAAAAGDDAIEAHWFNTNELPLMAFRSHTDFIRHAEQLMEFSE